MINRLLHQNSRYLRQHASNPVEWFPWGTEAFLTAREEKKPVLLSIGYSSCHWCHVMAHESFEDDKVARYLNENFVAVKVDKEEYPDVDGFYMEYLSRLTGNGGWPLNVFVNSNGAPFFGFTYLPRDRFLGVLERIRDEYPRTPGLLDREISDTTVYLHELDDEEVRNILSSADMPSVEPLGGPQFPQPLATVYLLERNNEKHVARILENLITKGLFDHIEGGWFRYTVDQEWKVPHFEKMLYDQATLLYLCARAYPVNKELCDYAIRMSIRWLREQMRLPNGLYCSATDADTDDGEGFYYTIPRTDNAEEHALFRLDEAGVHENRFVPWINFPRMNTHPVEYETIRERYRLERKKLIPPGTDSKVVTGWNAFLGYALLWAYERTGDSEYLEFAQEIHARLQPFTNGGSVPHVIYGETVGEGYEYLSDYAALLLFLGKLSRYRTELAGEPARITKLIREKFFHPSWLFHTTERAFESLSLWQDTPFPAGGSMLISALLELESEEVVPFVKVCSGISELAARNPSFFAYWLSAFSRFYAVQE